MRQSVNAVRKERPDIFSFLKGNEPLNNIFLLDSPIDKSRIELYVKAYEDIGNTPLHKINLAKNGNVLYTKLEYRNAHGSNHYSRYWLIYFFIAETLGLIKPERDEILEVTSGSSGIALSNACQLLGFRLTVFVPNLISKARIESIKGDGITIIESEGYIDQCIIDFKALRDKDKYKYFTPNHAEEKSDIILDVFKRIAIEFKYEMHCAPQNSILALGNGSSAKGIMQYFLTCCSNSHNSLFFGYQPNLSKVDLKPILGLRPPNVDFRHIDQFISDNLKIEYTDELNIQNVRKKFEYDSEIGKFGVTSLYAVSLALKCAEYTKQSTFFSIAYDTIDMYD